MQKEQAYELMNNNPAFYLATVDGDAPRVRGMLLYRAGEDGIIFHTGTIKDLYRQILANPNAELCFIDMKTNTQLRVRGVLEIVDDRKLKEEIVAHPSREFLRNWENEGEMESALDVMVVLRMRNGRAVAWTMATNFESAPEIAL